MKRILLTTFLSFIVFSSFGQVTVQDINVSLDNSGNASINTNDVLTSSLPAGTTATLSKSNFTCADLMPPIQTFSLSLDSTNDYAVVSHTPDLNLDGSWTLEGWIYRNSKNPGGDVIIDKWSGNSFFDEYSIFIFNDTFFAEVTTTTGNYGVAAAGITPALNQWYHVAGSFDRATGTLKIYIDGVLRGTTTGITGASLNSNNNTILGGIDWGNASINGLIDDVRIWDRVLTDTEIGQFYNQPLRGDELGLVANWKFEESFGNTTSSSTTQTYPAVYQENGVVSLISWAGNSAVTVGNNLNRIYLTATDSGGTSTDYPFVATVEEVVPQAIIQDISVNLDSSGNATITAQDVDNGSFANCSGIASLTLDRSNLDCNDIVEGNRGIRVNGVNQHVAIPASSANRITGNYTLSAWVKYDDTGIDRQYAVSIPSGFNGTGNSIYINKVNRFVSMTFIDGNTNAPNGLSTGPNVIMPDTWTHIAVSYDGVNAKIFINGVLSASQARTLLFPTSSQPLYLGVEGDGSIIGQRRFKGEIDEVRLWNVARTEKEIRDDMNFDISPQSTGLRALYRLDETSGTSIIDEVNGTSSSVFYNMNPAIDRIESDRVRGVPVTLTVTTNDGETDSVVAMVTVNDTSSPQVITQDVTVNLVNGSATITAQDIDNGSTAGACNSITNLTLDRTLFTCADTTMPVTVTLTATSTNGISDTGTAQVTVLENDVPVAIAQDLTVSTDAAGNATIDASMVDAGSYIGCPGSPVNIIVSPDTFDCTNIGPNTVTLTVTNSSGQTAVDTAIVTILDNSQTVARANPISVTLSPNGSASFTAQYLDNGSTGNCSGLSTILLSRYSVNCFDAFSGSATVTLTVISNDGQTDSVQTTITVNDLQGVFTQDISVTLDNNGIATITPQDVDAGSGIPCIDPNPTFSLNRDTFTCADAGMVVPVTLTMNINSGGAFTGIANVTVQDSGTLNAVAHDATVSLDATGNVTVDASQIDGGSTAGCAGIASIVVSPNTFDCTNLGDNTVTLTVTDGNGNTDTTTAIITVNLPPEDISFNATSLTGITITNPSDSEFSDINNDGLLDFAVLDNGYFVPFFQQNDGSYAPQQTGLGSIITSGVTNQGLQLADFDGDGLKDVILTNNNIINSTVDRSIFRRANNGFYSSIFNDSANGSFMIPIDLDNDGNDEILDRSSRLIMGVLSDALLQYDYVGGNFNLQSPTVLDPLITDGFKESDVDNDGDSDILAQVPFGTSGDPQVLVFYNDGNGVFTQETNVNLLGFLNDVVAGDINGDGSTDFISLNPTIGGSPTALNYIVHISNAIGGYDTYNFNSSAGTSIIDSELTDFNGDGKEDWFIMSNGDNINYESRIYEWDDASNTFIDTATIPVQVPSESTYEILDYENDGDTDLVLVDRSALTITLYESNPIAALDIITQDITVTLDNTGNASITPQQIDNGSNALCGVILSLDITDFDCTNVGRPIQVTLTGIDVAGNVATETAVVTVEDNLIPEITLNGNATETVGQGVVYTDAGATAIDNCGATSVVVSGDTVDTAVFGTYTITYTATDSAGNTSSADRVVTVADIVLPEIIAASITSDNGNSAFAKAGDLVTLTFTTSEPVRTPLVSIAMINAALSATANPNEWIATTFVPNTSSVDMSTLPDGMVPFTIDLEDLNANNSLTPQTITTDGSEVILDRTAPDVNAMNEIISLDVSGNGIFNLNDVVGSITDAYSHTASTDVNTIDCSLLGANAFNLFATDEAGNTGQDLFILTVIDEIAPVMTLNGNTTVTIDRGLSYIDAGVTISDNCSSGLIPSIGGDVVDTNISGTYEVTYDVSDTSGNAATQLTRTIIVKNPDFIYEGGSWTPNDPSDVANPAGFNDNVIVRENVTISGDFRANDLTINTGVTLTLAAGVTVGIDNDFNGDTLDAPQATLFAYGQAAGITWNLNNATIGSIELANATLNLTGTYRIIESLYNDDTASTSVLNVTGAVLTLGSTATQTAVIDGALLDVIGELTLEKYFKDRRAYRFISSPLTTTTTIFDNWQEGGLNPGDAGYQSGYGTHISGNGGAANGFDVTGSNNTSMFSWDNINQNWVSQSSTDAVTDLLVAGQFSRLFVRGDRAVDLTNNNSSSSTTLRTKGYLLNSSYTVPQISNNAGDFMIVGNPYQSQLDLSRLMNDLFNGVSGNINAVQPNFYYVWDPLANTRGAYRTYGRQVDAMIGPNAPNSNYDEAGVLQPGQAAFFLTSGTSGGTFVLDRTSNAITPPPVNISNTPNGQLHISLYETAQFNQGFGSLEGLLIRFENGANNAIDTNDAVKFNNLDENLGRAHITGTTLSIERRDLPQHGEVLPLVINNVRHNNYIIEVQPVGFTSKQAILKDNFNNTLTPLDNNQVTIYSYSIDAANASSIATDRFEIVFEDVTLSIGEGNLVSQAISIYPNPVLGPEFYIDFGNITGFKKVTIYNALGQKINTYNTEESSVYELKSDALAPGMYVIEIEKGDAKFVEQLIVK